MASLGINDSLYLPGNAFMELLKVFHGGVAPSLISVLLPPYFCRCLAREKVTTYLLLLPHFGWHAVLVVLSDDLLLGVSDGGFSKTSLGLKRGESRLSAERSQAARLVQASSLRVWRLQSKLGWWVLRSLAESVKWLKRLKRHCDSAQCQGRSQGWTT